MEQDLFDWLNSNKKNSNGTGFDLLLAPLSDSDSEHKEPEVVDTIPEIPEEPQKIEEPEEIEEVKNLDCQPESPISVDNEILPDFPEPEPESESEPEPEIDPELLKDHEWQERATGFTLSLDEPPPELWTGVNDDDDRDYEETDSLQGAAYVQIHGRNFTERLHHTLKNRKERAEERAEAERESTPSHPYLKKSIIFCSVLVMLLVLAWSSLWFLEGLSGVSKKAAREIPNVETIVAVSKEPEVQPKKPVPPIEKPPTFEDLLDEANHAYNIGMYNRSVVYFFKAHEVKPRDIRPYIGLSNAYRMKGMYFDSRRILDEARGRFRRNPDIEMGYIFLREEK